MSAQTKEPSSIIHNPTFTHYWALCLKIPVLRLEVVRFRTSPCHSILLIIGAYDVHCVGSWMSSHIYI